MESRDWSSDVCSSDLYSLSRKKSSFLSGAAAMLRRYSAGSTAPGQSYPYIILRMAGHVQKIPPIFRFLKIQSLNATNFRLIFCEFWNNTNKPSSFRPCSHAFLFILSVSSALSLRSLCFIPYTLSLMQSGPAPAGIRGTPLQRSCSPESSVGSC